MRQTVHKFATCYHFSWTLYHQSIPIMKSNKADRKAKAIERAKQSMLADKKKVETNKAKHAAEKISWVQCDQCGKWRQLPSHMLSKELLPSEWYCSLMTWSDGDPTCIPTRTAEVIPGIKMTKSPTLENHSMKETHTEALTDLSSLAQEKKRLAATKKKWEGVC